MKRQNSQLSSASRRRDPPPESLRAKSIGCMSGIVHLLSKYGQNRHKKSLTFGIKSKEEKNIIVFSTSSPSDQTLAAVAGLSPATPPPQRSRRSRSDKQGNRTDVVVDFGRFKSSTSCDLKTRSPTLSAEIRRTSSANSPAKIKKSPALVARLMGLESAAAEEETTSSNEKRRKLLGALEKCDNDLKALKEIIMAYRSPESDSPATPIAGTCLDRDQKVRTNCGRKCNCDDGEKQQASAASVLNESTRMRLHKINRTARGRENGREETQQQQEETKKKNPAASEDVDTMNISISSFNYPITKLQERITKLQHITGTELETKPSKTTTTMEMMKKKKKWAENDEEDAPLTRRSKAMGQSLEEISKEMAWGFKQEMAKIGMDLQHYIYKELIDEMVTDMAFSNCYFLPFESSSFLPPYEACRRRLHF